MIFVAIGLFTLSMSAIISYAYRKTPGTLAIPKVPEHISFGIPLIVIVVMLGILLPLFGLSVLLLFLYSKLMQRQSLLN